MSRTTKTMLLIVWLIIATHVYAYVWSNHLDVFPQLPEEFGIWIAKLTGTANTENIEQLTLYYIFIISFVVVAIATFLCALVVWGCRRIRKSRQ